MNIPTDIFDKTLVGEFTLWHNYWLHYNQLPILPLALGRCYLDRFSGICVLLQILITFSVTNATAERKFSSLLSQNMDEVQWRI